MIALDNGRMFKLWPDVQIMAPCAYLKIKIRNCCNQYEIIFKIKKNKYDVDKINQMRIFF